jgi:hypothetical protein
MSATDDTSIPKFILLTRPDGTSEVYTPENYTGFYEWYHQLIIEGVYIAESGNRYELFDPETSGNYTESNLSPHPTGATQMSTQAKQSLATDATATTGDTPTLFTTIYDFLTNSVPHDPVTTQNFAFAWEDYITNPSKYTKEYVDSMAFEASCEDVWTHLETFKTSPTYLQLINGANQMSAQATPATVVSPEIAAASDSRVLDIIENMLLECSYNALMTDDLVLTIQEYLKDSSVANKSTLTLLADTSRLRGVFKLTQKIKNSPEFQALVDLNTPDDITPISVQEASKPAIVAVGTTAEAVVTTNAAKGSKGKARIYPAWAKVERNPDNYCLQLTRADGSTEKLTIDTLISQYTTRGEEELAVFNEIKANGFATHNTLFLEICQHKPSSEPTKASKGGKGSAKPKEKLPMPSLKTIAEIEALDRKALIKAVQAVKSNNPDITLRANAASADLQKLLASELMGVDYTAPPKPTKAPKATKGNAKPVTMKEDIDLSTLTWEGCKDMSYRQLQQVCAALKLQGLFSGNCGGKGATTENFMKGIANYFKSKGVNITEAVMSGTTNPIKPIKTPHLDAARANKASRVAVAA